MQDVQIVTSQDDVCMLLNIITFGARGAQPPYSLPLAQLEMTFSASSRRSPLSSAISCIAARSSSPPIPRTASSMTHACKGGGSGEVSWDSEGWRPQQQPGRPNGHANVQWGRRPSVGLFLHGCRSPWMQPPPPLPQSTTHLVAEGDGVAGRPQDTEFGGHAGQ